jgi:hypothetical protein
LVAGLLTEPSLQENTLRIELLIHLLLTFGAGNGDASHQDISRWIHSELGATGFALMEDPPEDVFVSNVTTPNGNFRIFEGTWESSDFYLQRVLNVVETLPSSDASRQLRQEVFAILKLSEEIAARRGLDRFSPGGGNDKQHDWIPSWQQMRSLCRAITFSARDLKCLQIMPTDLEPFTLPKEK